MTDRLWVEVLEVIYIHLGCHSYSLGLPQMTTWLPEPEVVLGWYWNWFSTEIVLLGCVLWPASTGYYLAWNYMKWGQRPSFRLCAPKEVQFLIIVTSDHLSWLSLPNTSGSQFASAFVHQAVLHQSLHLIYLSVHRWWLLLLHFCSCGLSSQLVGP